MFVRKRSGFTLVELLVVIAIISILVGLAMVAVMAVRGKQPLVTTKIEMEQMIQGLELFKTRHSIYPPSEVTVGPDKNAVEAADGNSTYVLSRIWPSLDYGQAFGPNGMNVTGGTLKLKGDQCLVFFLGGRHGPGGCIGFSESRTNPLALGGDREQPFFKFQPARLFQRDPANPFFSYGDGFFKTSTSEGLSTNSYAYFAPLRSGYLDTHCNSVLDPKGSFPRPFKDAAGQYINRQSFQLLSAGRDSLWGKSRVWTSAGGLGDLAGDPVNRDSIDNIANFAACGLIGG